MARRKTTKKTTATKTTTDEQEPKEGTEAQAAEEAPGVPDEPAPVDPSEEPAAPQAQEKAPAATPSEVKVKSGPATNQPATPMPGFITPQQAEVGDVKAIQQATVKWATGVINGAVARKASAGDPGPYAIEVYPEQEGGGAGHVDVLVVDGLQSPDVHRQIKDGYLDAGWCVVKVDRVVTGRSAGVRVRLVRP